VPISLTRRDGGPTQLHAFERTRYCRRRWTLQ
jgi:hypothetical protein